MDIRLMPGALWSSYAMGEVGCSGSRIKVADAPVVMC